MSKMDQQMLTEEVVLMILLFSSKWIKKKSLILNI